MQEEWFQIWVTVPIMGRQWGGWFRGNRYMAQGLAETFKTSAAQQLGFIWEIFDQAGNPVQSLIPGGFNLPGLLGLPGLKIPGITF